MTVKELIERIKLEGANKIVFNVNLRPVRRFEGLPIVFTTSSDKEVTIPCKIDTNRYDPFENYKIAVKSMIHGFGGRSYYIEDFVSLMNKGLISIR